MKKYIAGLFALLAVVLFICGCSSHKASKEIQKMADSLSSVESAAVTITLDFQGTISGSSSDMPYSIHISSDGIVRREPYFQEEWFCSYDKILYEKHTSVSYDLAGAVFPDSGYAGITRLHGEEEWTSLEDPSPLSSDYLLQEIILRMKTDASETGTGISCSLSGNALLELVTASLYPAGSFDFSGYDWDQFHVPVTIERSDSTFLPSGFTADCQTIGSLVAETIADKDGMQVSIESCTIVVMYTDYNRISSFPLPSALDSSTLFNME